MLVGAVTSVADSSHVIVGTVFWGQAEILEKARHISVECFAEVSGFLVVVMDATVALQVSKELNQLACSLGVLLLDSLLLSLGGRPSSGSSGSSLTRATGVSPRAIVV